jgi:hypothetical protein
MIEAARSVVENIDVVGHVRYRQLTSYQENLKAQANAYSWLRFARVFGAHSVLPSGSL